MSSWIGAYGVVWLVVVLLAVATTLFVHQQRKRARTGGPPPGYVRTDEVFTDPTTGNTFRVWYNPRSGDRFYQRLETDEDRPGMSRGPDR